MCRLNDQGVRPLRTGTSAMSRCMAHRHTNLSGIVRPFGPPCRLEYTLTVPLPFTGIIITDLDDFADSDGESSTTPLFTSTSTPYKISNAYLSRFGNIPRAEFDFEDLGDVDNNRQALIAYRPLVQTINTVPSPPNVFRGYIEEVEDGVVSSPTTLQDVDTEGFVVEPYPEDAMDIDME